MNVALGQTTIEKAILVFLGVSLFIFDMLSGLSNFKLSAFEFYFLVKYHRCCVQP